MEPGALESLIGNDPAVIASVLDTYLHSVTIAAGEFATAVSQRQARRAADLAHLIKSPSGSVGARGLYAVCAAVEAAIAADDWPIVESLASQLQTALQAVERECRTRTGARVRGSSDE
jgi:HPt (histidine-containing phosphotransfer) domain-containing protein